MLIVLITSHAPTLVTFRLVLIKSLISSGFEVCAIAPCFDDSTKSTLDELKVKQVVCNISRTGMNPFRDLCSFIQLVVVLIRLKPSVVLSYFVKPVIYGTLASWVAGVKYRFAMIEGLGFVFTNIDSKISLKRKALKWLVVSLYKLSLGRATRTIFLNPDDQNEFITNDIVSPQKSYLWGGIGVDLNQWVMTPPLKAPVTFLMVARLLREKGLLDFVCAAQIVKTEYTNVRFILLGQLDDNPGSIDGDVVNSWVADGLLEWYGHVPVYGWLKQSSVFVLPSYREGVPVSTQEALATGRAVITTNVPGCRQTVIDGLNGFVVAPGNPNELANRIIHFIRNPGLIESMGIASRQLAEQYFDVYKNNERLVNLILSTSNSI